MENTNITKEILDKPIEDLDLSVRVYNRLKRADIYSVGALLRYSENDLLSMSFFGSKGVEEIKEKLSSFEGFNLHLGMQDEDEMVEVLEFLSDEEKEELEKMTSLIEQKEQEAKKAEFMVSRVKENRDRLLYVSKRKKAALEELQALSEEQERLKAESESLDEQIALVVATLGLSNIDTNNSEMSNDGKQLQ